MLLVGIIELGVAREKDQQALHFLAHELKNRFVAARGVLSETRPADALQREAFGAVLENLERGIFLCVDRSVAIELSCEKSCTM